LVHMIAFSLVWKHTVGLSWFPIGFHTLKCTANLTIHHTSPTVILSLKRKKKLYSQKWQRRIRTINSIFLFVWHTNAYIAVVSTKYRCYIPKNTWTSLFLNTH
jgi:hypothetical protein